MSGLLIIIALLAFAATMFGGLFALRFKDKSHLIIGFSAGAVIGVAFFDLLPESTSLGLDAGVSNVSLFIALGFLVYLVADRIVGLHSHNHGDEHHDHDGSHGTMRATSFSVHSFLDGVAIGLTFHVSSALGIVVAIAVLAHDFSDGINTVAAIIRSGGEKKQALRWLVADSIAPVLGIFSTLFFTIPTGALAVLLSIFCGFFLYIGASDLIPESYHAHPTKWTTIATILGAGLIYVVISVVG